MRDEMLYMTPAQQAEIWKINLQKAKVLRVQLEEAERIQESAEYLLGIHLRTEEVKMKFANNLLSGTA